MFLYNTRLIESHFHRQNLLIQNYHAIRVHIISSFEIGTVFHKLVIYAANCENYYFRGSISATKTT